MTRGAFDSLWTSSGELVSPSGSYAVGRALAVITK